MLTVENLSADLNAARVRFPGAEAPVLIPSPRAPFGAGRLALPQTPPGFTAPTPTQDLLKWLKPIDMSSVRPLFPQPKHPVLAVVVSQSCCPVQPPHSLSPPTPLPRQTPRTQARRGSRANSEAALRSLPEDVRQILEAKTRLDRELYARAAEMAPGPQRPERPAAGRRRRASGPCYALRESPGAGAAAAEDGADSPEALAAWDALLEEAAAAGRDGRPAPAPGLGFYGGWSNRTAPFDGWARCRRPGAGVGGGEVHVAACVASAPPLGVAVSAHEERVAEWITRCALAPSSLLPHPQSPQGSSQATACCQCPPSRPTALPPLPPAG